MKKANMEGLTRRPLRSQKSPGKFQTGSNSDDSEIDEDNDFDCTGDESIGETTYRSPKKKDLYPKLPLDDQDEKSSKWENKKNKTENFASVNNQQINQQSHAIYPPLHDTGPQCYSEKQASENNHSSKFWMYALLILIPSLVYGYKLMSQTDSLSGEIMNARKVVQKLDNKFCNQPRLSLKIIKAALEKVIDENFPEPTHPAILLLLGSKGADDITLNFAKELAHLVSFPNQSYLNLNGQNINKDPHRGKEEIDGKIKGAFSSEGQNVVLIENLDLIPGEVAMMLHSYCDHENAPFKKAVFIMTMSGEEQVSKDADSRKFDSAANNHLRKAWNDLDIDQLSPLLSRLTVSVAIILAN